MSNRTAKPDFIGDGPGLVGTQSEERAERRHEQRRQAIAKYPGRQRQDRRSVESKKKAPLPCPGCGRVLDWPFESGRWRVKHTHWTPFPSPGEPFRRMSPNTTCVERCHYQHEHQDQWVDCPGAVPEKAESGSVPSRPEVGAAPGSSPEPDEDRITEIRLWYAEWYQGHEGEWYREAPASGIMIGNLLAALDAAEAENAQLQKERAICRGEYKGELDGKPVPGNFLDGTEGACPGWWRGQEHGAKKMEARAKKAEESNARLRDAAARLGTPRWSGVPTPPCWCPLTSSGVRASHTPTCNAMRAAMRPEPEPEP